MFLALLVALVAPGLLYALQKRWLWRRQHGRAQVRTYEDYSEMLRICGPEWAQRYTPPKPRWRWRLASYALTLAMILALLGPSQTSVDVTEMAPPPPEDSLTALLLGTELPPCPSTTAPHCCIDDTQCRESVRAPALDFYVDTQGHLHFVAVLEPGNRVSTQQCARPTLSLVSEARLTQLLGEQDERCVCARALGLRANCSFLERRHAQQRHWVVLYEPVLQRNASDGHLVHTRWSDRVVSHYSEFTIEFSVVSVVMPIDEEARLLHHMYSERLQRHNLSVLQRVVVQRQRLPLRLAGSEAACFSHCQ